MTKQTYSKNLETFGKVITSLATDAALDVEGITLPEGKKSRGAVSMYFLPNEKVTVEFYVNIMHGYTVPLVVSTLQETVKEQIERATKFKVHTVNVHVMNVSVEQ
ncbi:MAG: Asp23/Gls24 family envelope stress response protein [Clostridia bacterium]|nr:Asp23/Gls24 family envelope stress response protein [Clostridia bacterium]